MEKLVEFLVLSLAQDKESVSVFSEEKENETVLTVSLSEQDFGRVIGKNGKNAQAIRTLANLYAKLHEDNKKYTIKFE